MTPALARQRCWTHPHREAVSRCPQCKRFYCRECVTEHEGRLLCVSCLAARAGAASKSASTRWLLWTAAALLGLAFGWIYFYTTGYILQQIPPSWAKGSSNE